MLLANFGIVAICDAQVIDRILAAPEQDRVGLVVEELRSNVAILENKVLDMQWKYAGKVKEVNYGDDTFSRARPNRNVHIVAGQDMFWQEADELIVYDMSDSRIDTYAKERSVTYRKKRGVIVEVNMDCSYPNAEGELDVLCDLTPCIVWHKANNTMTPAVFHDFLLSCDWQGEVTKDGQSMREIAVGTKRSRGSSTRAKFEKQYRFAEVEGQLVHTGVSNRSLSPQKTPGTGEEWDSVGIWEYQYQFRKYDGIYLPSSIHATLTELSLNADGTPFKDYKPIESRNVTWQLTACKVSDRFPEKLLQVTVPSTARVVDHCRNREERAIHQEIAKSGWSRKNWLIIGVLLCCVGLALTWYWRRRR